jgi:hypothetical protein
MQAINEHVAKDGFRLRGTHMSRIDGFSDVVFGFALTLLVVSVEVPHTYDELHALMLGFFPFAICFSLFFAIWWAHFRFFRRFGLHDPATIVLNAMLLFTVLFYVYPMKFLFAMAVSTSGQKVFSNPLQIRELMIVYGLGFAAIYFLLSALYFNAWRQRTHLRLNPMEITLTLSYLWDSVGVGCIGLLCCLIARLLPPEHAGQAGFFFFAIGIWKTGHGIVSGRYVRRAEARTSPADRAALPHTM